MDFGQALVKMARLNYFVPVPEVKDFDELNAYLEQRCAEDLERKLRGKGATKQQLLEEDRAAYHPLPASPFDFKAQPSINRTLVNELMRGEYLDAHENILFMGNPGTGKTHIATALGHAACAQGKRVRFFSVTGLVNQLLELRQDREVERLLKRIEKLHLLVLDEFGYVPFSKAGAELLFEVASRAYERQSLIITTNLPFEAWTEILANERFTGALLDRVTFRARYGTSP